ncbi:hypothetical protein O7605_31790 [Verrucosispora sp. WMMA2121]|uniref:hypothetical protein n=1 Tax=Verrucosispora sp. WMMA2121 TaxID=3015164 RepID=UPI0022B747A9|nr:hypothetical protein [Verrucosispora sp. WMMA2121]MCZ7423778.1 hypothetical protein [Verrucosispora sp. WMMA2121]MCZ7424080.1 hypothetical protein [Verrucosispora sp. WMMA2121]MCZ7424095.1 hypothetical protein [Verrucosispora sp. WMMA2121]
MFSIDAARALIAATPRDTQPLDVATWATAYGLTRLDDPHQRVASLIGPTSTALDRAYAMTTDLKTPVIVAQLDISGHPPAPLLIDGTHRLYRAWREHLPRLPAHLLTAEETRQVQDNTLLRPGRTSITGPPT